MKHFVKLFDYERLDTLVDYFYFLPICEDITDFEYERLEKEVVAYCAEDGIDFWDDNIHMFINGKEYAKTDRPTTPDWIHIEDDPSEPYFEPMCAGDRA